jgi:hypothetical protein
VQITASEEHSLKGSREGLPCTSLSGGHNVNELGAIVANAVASCMFQCRYADETVRGGEGRSDRALDASNPNFKAANAKRRGNGDSDAVRGGTKCGEWHPARLSAILPRLDGHAQWSSAVARGSYSQQCRLSRGYGLADPEDPRCWCRGANGSEGGGDSEAPRQTHSTRRHLCGWGHEHHWWSQMNGLRSSRRPSI